MSEKTAWQKAADKAAEDLEGFGMAAENVILKGRIAALQSDKDWWENTCNEWRESCQKAQRERDSAIISSDMWWRATGELNALLDEIRGLQRYEWSEDVGMVPVTSGDYVSADELDSTLNKREQT